jgi:hypothetical protein
VPSERRAHQPASVVQYTSGRGDGDDDEDDEDGNDDDEEGSVESVDACACECGCGCGCECEELGGAACSALIESVSISHSLVHSSCDAVEDEGAVERVK